jgi:hypothetical protein
MVFGGLQIDDFREDSISEALGNTLPAKYIVSYLQALEVKGVLREKHYVDRHYLDDFAKYYSKSFESPVSYCERLHFFSIGAARISDVLDNSCEGIAERDEAESILGSKYLGFVVLRPLIGAKVGRTVLKTYPQDGSRRYTVVRPYKVHLAGLKFHIEGLAYQEQDQGTAVCASIALWFALQRVAYLSGHRTPTPSAITEAAKSPLPASYGLDDSQMATALNSLGYVADLFRPAENGLQFKARIVACLESQLPVIFILIQEQDTGEGMVTAAHAVTVTGFQMPPRIVSVPSSNLTIEPIKMRSGSLQTIYAHDDNIGPHAHYEIYETEERNSDGHKILKLHRGPFQPIEEELCVGDEWSIYAALVPKNDKMRLPIEDLFSSLFDLRSTFEQVFRDEPDIVLHYSVKSASGIEYKRNLFSCSFDPQDLRVFLSNITLPRYVGVVQVYAENFHLCDAIIDISEANRTNQHLLAIVSPGVQKRSAPWRQIVRTIEYLESSERNAPSLLFLPGTDPPRE